MAENQVTQNEMAEQEQEKETPVVRKCIRCKRSMDREGRHCQACCKWHRERCRKKVGSCSKCGKSTGKEVYRVCADCRKVVVYTNGEPKYLCRRCGEPKAVSERQFCRECKRQSMNAAQKKQREKRKAAGLCELCCKPNDMPSGVCTECREKTKERNRKIKKKVMETYGGCCVCCGETLLDALTIDHANDDGHEHRMSGLYGGICGISIYRWIIRNNYPKDLRVLCWTCNIARKINGGVCPHQDEHAIRCVKASNSTPE